MVNKNGEVTSLNQLISHLEIIINQSDVMGPAIGILTSDKRDNWSKSFQELMKGKFIQFYLY